MRSGGTKISHRVGKCDLVSTKFVFSDCNIDFECVQWDTPTSVGD